MRHSSVLHTAHIWKTFLWCFLAFFVKRSKSNWKVVTLSELCYKCQLSWKNLATKEIGRAHFREKGVFVIPIAMRWQILVKLASVMLYEWQGGNCPSLSPGTLRLKGLDENNPDMLTFHILTEETWVVGTESSFPLLGGKTPPTGTGKQRLRPSSSLSTQGFREFIMCGNKHKV